MIRSAFFPISNDPYCSERPKAAALLIVAAAKASGKLIRQRTHAKFIEID